jgi:hypothetical protein
MSRHDAFLWRMLLEQAHLRREMEGPNIRERYDAAATALQIELKSRFHLPVWHVLCWDALSEQDKSSRLIVIRCDATVNEEPFACVLRFSMELACSAKADLGALIASDMARKLAHAIIEWQPTL